MLKIFGMQKFLGVACVQDLVSNKSNVYTHYDMRHFLFMTIFITVYLCIQNI